MVSFDLNDPVRNTDNHYRNINRMLNSATCAAGGIGLLTPVVCSPRELSVLLKGLLVPKT
ncbi:Hypothetical protein CTDLC_013501 [Chlamydia trachomatis D-LC]|uniref:Uncharacterized protein n=1 Tax=Chlamydia trachomatis TaxID=813 RepID=E2DI27_CHLTH|nr:Hypothetical protein CTDLC_013501 [Chlamydia trachomatis D-LC]ADO14229.1 hypothetical protein CT135_1 [Chlamydia trachomatis]